MATTSNVQVNSSVGVDGNSYTTAVSNDKLTNDDFLKLMIQELKKRLKKFSLIQLLYKSLIMKK